MKNLLKRGTAAGLALALISAVPALADDNHGGPGGQSHQNVQHQSVQHQNVQHQTVQHETVHNNTVVVNHTNNYNNNSQHYNQPQHVNQQAHYWHHGDHYDGQRHYVSNWQYYHLRQPPEGYEWVQDNNTGEFVLIAVASGVIASIFLNGVYQ